MGQVLSRSQKANGKQRPKRRTVKLPTKYSHDFPISGGHDYGLRSVPRTIWNDAISRAHAQQESIRSVLIRALALYGSGRLDL